MRSEKGVALVLALFVAVVISVVVVSMLDLTTTDLKVARNLQEELKAYYIAEAGAETAIRELKNDINWSDGFENAQFPPGSNGSFTVTISHPDSSLIEITSVGKIGETSKTVKVTLKVE